MDNACVELKFANYSIIAIDTIAVENGLPIICISGQNWTGCSTISLLNMCNRYFMVI